MGGEVNLDFFHLGLLLVVIMVFITGIVLCVAVVGVCCFHWLDNSKSHQSEAGATDGDKSPTPSQIREQIWRLDNELAQQLRRYQELRGKRRGEGPDIPPSYETLFPIPPQQASSSNNHNAHWRDNFTLFV